MFSDARIAKIRAAEQEFSARVLSIFDDVDVVITPGTATGPSKIGAYRRLGAVSTLSLVAARVPFQIAFNATGQPAAVVPWGWTAQDCHCRFSWWADPLTRPRCCR